MWSLKNSAARRAFPTAPESSVTTSRPRNSPGFDNARLDCPSAASATDRKRSPSTLAGRAAGAPFLLSFSAAAAVALSPALPLLFNGSLRRGPTSRRLQSFDALEGFTMNTPCGVLGAAGAAAVLGGLSCSGLTASLPLHLCPRPGWRPDPLTTAREDEVECQVEELFRNGHLNHPLDGTRTGLLVYLC